MDNQQKRYAQNISSLSCPPSRLVGGRQTNVIVLLGDAWSIYKQRLGTFLGVMIIPTLITVILGAVLTSSGFLSFSFLFSGQVVAGTGLLFFLAILFVIIIFIIQIWSQIALLYVIKDREENIGVREAYRSGWRKIFSYLWVVLLVGLVVLGGFLLLIVPAIIFAVWFSLANFVLIAEDIKGVKALRKSKEYVKGKWGGVFWRFLFIGALSVILSQILILVFAFLPSPFKVGIIQFVTGLFLTPLVVIYSFLIYNNLKVLKVEAL